ncbi:MAG: Dyp-type peroxidase [Propionibacteriaceae bacterium]|jgi:putative iron-dependent peroxidase|nr:Dyp-type peroxidase [Propionibacteriaceae bacterium]
MSNTVDSAITTATVKDAQDVFKDIGRSVIFAVLAFRRQDRDAELAAVRETFGRLPALVNSMNIRAAGSGLRTTIGLSNAAWDYLFPGADKPRELETFRGVTGDKNSMPSSDGDLFLHLRADNEAVIYELMDQVRGFLGDSVTVVDETHGFRYFEGRAIIGFIDGTEAPAVKEAAGYAIVGDEDPGFVGGSYAFAQKWLHDMDQWKSLSTQTQERMVGRQKFSDIELSDDHKDEHTHNNASKVEIDGDEKKIVRMNVPFSNPAEQRSGTYFIGYARHWTVTRTMLTQMVERSDALLSFSTLLSGQVFFVPSWSLLDRMAQGEF